MHRDILDIPPGLECDHIDGNGLNNQKNNLRLVTHRENCQNLHITKTSTLVGVHWDKWHNQWRSGIRVNGKLKNLGSFPTEEDAHNAYIAAFESINT